MTSLTIFFPTGWTFSQRLNWLELHDFDIDFRLRPYPCEKPVISQSQSPILCDSNVMKTPFDLFRSFISAMTASLNAENKSGQDKAQIEIDDLKKKLAATKQAPESHGIPLSADEQAHAIALLQAAKDGPAIAVPAQPTPPNTPEPVSAPVAPAEPAFPFGSAPFIPTTTPAFKTGDKVKVTKDFFGAAKVGDEGVVISSAPFDDEKLT